MKLFTIDENGKFIQFIEKEFKEENKEIYLEDLLEKNPEYFFEGSQILIIGRQVSTNLNSIIDLLGIDQYGNTVVIELKRDKTPRETLTQLIEYASYIDNLDYDQLNEIFQNYTGEDSTLEDYHKEYFKSDLEQETISWNKNSKLVIVASKITKDIKQTALYMRKWGIDIYCVEFKYFTTSAENKMISSDFVIGDENFIKGKIITATSLPKTTKENFLNDLDNNGRKVFNRIFDFIDKQNLKINWGSKGFSGNITYNSTKVGIIYGWPINSPWGQTLVTGFGQIEKKIESSETIINKYKADIEQLGIFNETVYFFKNQEFRWTINSVDDTKLETLIKILENVTAIIRENLLNRAST
jgi:hypothetical protein